MLLQNKRITRQNRKSNRLKKHNYAQPGYYFVTVCTKNKIEYFGRIINGKMILNKTGEIVSRHWSEIIKYFSNIKLDSFVLMPNHIHGIIIIQNT
jgi:REP element-mobilizing transposase RayT